MLDEGDLEGLAEAVYRLAGLDPDDVSTPLRLAKKLLGPDGVRYVPNLRELGTLFALEGKAQIAVRKSLPPAMRSFVIGHEIGHWILKRERCSSETELERACDYIGAALIVPRRAFRSSVRRHGDDWTQLALDFGCSETMAALRYGEVVGTPLAVVAQVVRVRGGAYGWPETPEQIRRLARLPALPGLKRARLNDDPRRVVLEADDLLDDVG